jgi:large subunit ribosomal protein L25
LNIVRHEIELRCPVDAIPNKITVDLDGLDIGDSVHISMVTLPGGVTPTITDRDFTIASIAAPSAVRAEALEAQEAAAAAAAVPEEPTPETPAVPGAAPTTPAPGATTPPATGEKSS